MEETITIFIGIGLLVLFGSTLYSSTNELKMQKKEDSEDDTIDIKKGTYALSPFESVCSKCNIKNIPISEAEQFTTSSTVGTQEFPICFDYNKTNKKCCVVEKDNVYFGCPKFCFDSVKNSLQKDDTYTEEQYKTILKSNKYCNNI